MQNNEKTVQKLKKDLKNLYKPKEKLEKSKFEEHEICKIF